MSEILAGEAEKRERERREIQRAVDAFPTLATTTGQPEPSVGQPRKVVSLNSETRKVTVASYNVKPTVQHVSSTPTVEAVDIPTPPPPREIDYVRGKTAVEGRPWQNLRDDTLIYVPLPTQRRNAEGSQHRRKRGNKAKEPSVP
jgi:hypothetical protein